MVTIGKSNLDLSIEAKNHRVSANLQIFYEHAARTINDIMDARQSDCTNVSAGFCNTSGTANTCTQSAILCMFVPDPFDPISGWTKIPFINGAPAFESRLLKPTKGVITNDHGVVVAKYSSSCTHSGTSVE
jgi:hypothetical protein